MLVAPEAGIRPRGRTPTHLEVAEGWTNRPSSEQEDHHGRAWTVSPVRRDDMMRHLGS